MRNIRAIAADMMPSPGKDKPSTIPQNPGREAYNTASRGRNLEIGEVC
jgi:hypothetical protein